MSSTSPPGRWSRNAVSWKPLNVTVPEMPAVQSGHGLPIARTLGSVIGKPFGARYSAPSGAPAHAVPTSYVVPANDTVVRPRPQRAKSVERHTPSGYPTCAWVVWPANDEPIPVSPRATFASGPQFSGVGIGTRPSSWSWVAPRLVTILRFFPPLIPRSKLKSGFCTSRNSLVSSQPLFSSAPALTFRVVKPVDGASGTPKITSCDLAT